MNNSTRNIITLTKTEVEQLVKAAGEIDHPFMRVMLPAVISFTIRTGLRQSEVFALKWEDVDFSNASIFVKESKNGPRRIMLMPEDVAALKKYQDWQEKYMEESGAVFAESNLVFPTPSGEPIDPVEFIRDYIKPLTKKCGFANGLFFHSLRHTYTTRLLEQGKNSQSSKSTAS